MEEYELFPEKENANDIDMSNELINLAMHTDEDIYEQAKKVMMSVVEYKELMMMYSCAIKEVRTKFDVLNTEFNIRYKRNPIKFINTRLKSSSSLIQKLQRKNLAFTRQNIENNINDVAGIRVICAYIDDIYKIADALINQDDIKLIEKKDYITTPKKNGYRSLHLIVSVPVFFSEDKRDINVEVQIRTIAMDFWASLEHQMKYKQNIPEAEVIGNELLFCAEMIASLDERMQDIRCLIDENNKNQKQSEKDIFLERISRLDIAID